MPDCSGTLSELMQVLCALGYVEPNAAGARDHGWCCHGGHYKNCNLSFDHCCAAEDSAYYRPRAIL